VQKATALRTALAGGNVLLAMGAHNGISARLAERHGFDAIWASSFEISAAYGVPDASILTMTEFLAAAQNMNESVSLPIIADCDSGFGDASIVEYMTRKYAAAGIAAVCIEDKRFPKMNSFVGGHQHLESVSDFSDKIAASVGARNGSDLVVIARTEALIVGRPMDEALSRAHAYADAGADLILIHSKKCTADEVLEFAKRWGRRTPLVVVPTTYPELTADEFQRAGVQIVIYANHAMRSAVRAMDETMARIHLARTTKPVEQQIASMEEIFELQGVAQIKRAVAS
jgi:phosphoenolpyruvate phosphomutase